MRKKILSILLAGVLTVLLMPCDLSAMENETTENETADTSCYIATTSCPEGYIDFAEENASNFVFSMEGSLDYEEIEIGTPFAFADYNADVYYFPVICDGVITYLFRVYPDGESYSAAITEFLAADIEELSALTSAENPMYLNLTDNQIVATIGTEEYMLFEYPEDIGSNTQAAAMSLQDYEVVDAKENSGMELNLIQARYTFKYITLDITETQGNDSWCTAYCLSTIIRTQTTFYANAEGCTIIALGSNPSTTSVFPWSSIATVSKQYSLYPTVLYTTASDSVLIEELNALRPVIASMKCGSYCHSVVLRGYNTVGTWSIWNPYNTYYESYSMTGAYVPSGGSASTSSYYPYSHAYNFG